LRFLTFNPPLIHPLQADLVAVGIWGEVKDGFDLERLRRLDAAITDWTRANPNYRRYVQTELLFPDFDYRAHFGASRYDRLVRLRQVLAPLGMLSQGVVEAPAAMLVRRPDVAADPDLSSHVAAALLPFRVGGLIDASSRERIAAVAASLPAGASRFFGFECRLANTEPTADFLAWIAAHGLQREAWARWLAKDAPQSDVTRRLAGFVENWADPGSAHYSNVGNMWVEFDLAAPYADGSTPNLFLGSDKLGAAQAESEGHSWLVDA